MNLCRTFRAFTSLALDALEGLGWLFAFDDVADVIWSECVRADEARAVAYVVREYADRYAHWVDTAYWKRTADKLDRAADAMK